MEGCDEAEFWVKFKVEPPSSHLMSSLSLPGNVNALSISKIRRDSNSPRSPRIDHLKREECSPRSIPHKPDRERQIKLKKPSGSDIVRRQRSRTVTEPKENPNEFDVVKYVTGKSGHNRSRSVGGAVKTKGNSKTKGKSDDEETEIQGIIHSPRNFRKGTNSPRTRTRGSTFNEGYQSPKIVLTTNETGK